MIYGTDVPVIIVGAVSSYICSPILHFNIHIIKQTKNNDSEGSL